MRSIATLLAFVVAASTPATAQEPIVVGDGWEGFSWVEYKGGDARFPRARWGMLVLTDSTLAFHDCLTERCIPRRGGRPVWKPEPIFSIDLRTITEVQASTRVKPADAGSKLVFGALATDRHEGMVGVVFETATSAEAPVFGMKDIQASALEAKLNFRLKRLRAGSSEGTPLH